MSSEGSEDFKNMSSEGSEDRSEDSNSETGEHELTKEERRRVSEHGAIYWIGDREQKLYKWAKFANFMVVEHPIYDPHWMQMQADDLDEIEECLTLIAPEMRKNPKEKFILNLPPLKGKMDEEKIQLEKLNKFMKGWIHDNKDLANLENCTVVTPWQPGGEKSGINDEIDPETEKFILLLKKAKIHCFRTKSVVRNPMNNWTSKGRATLIFHQLLERYGPDWNPQPVVVATRVEYRKAKEISGEKGESRNYKDEIKDGIADLKSQLRHNHLELQGHMRHCSRMINHNMRLGQEVWNDLTKFGDVSWCLMCGSVDHNSNDCKKDYLIDPLICLLCKVPHTGPYCSKDTRKTKINKQMPRELVKFHPEANNGRANNKRDEYREEGRPSKPYKKVVPAQIHHEGTPLEPDYDNDKRPEASPSQLNQRRSARWKKEAECNSDESTRGGNTQEPGLPLVGGIGTKSNRWVKASK